MRPLTYLRVALRIRSFLTVLKKRDDYSPMKRDERIYLDRTAYGTALVLKLRKLLRSASSRIIMS